MFTRDRTPNISARETVGYSLLLGVASGLVGIPLSFALDWSWYAAPIVGVTGFFVAASILVASDRWDRRTAITAKLERGKKKRSEMRIELDWAGDHKMEYLYLNSNVTKDQLSEYATAILNGASMNVHKWIGEGALFTRGQYEDFMTELEKMGYARPGSGNVARSLTLKGKALMRALAECV